MPGQRKICSILERIFIYFFLFQRSLCPRYSPFHFRNAARDAIGKCCEQQVRLQVVAHGQLCFKLAQRMLCLPLVNRGMKRKYLNAILRRRHRLTSITISPANHAFVKKSPNDSISSVVFSPDGRIIVIITANHMFVHHVLSNGTIGPEITVNQRVKYYQILSAVVFDTTNRFLIATGDVKGQLKFWQMSADRKSVNCVGTLDKWSGGHKCGITSIAFRPIAPRIVTSSLASHIVTSGWDKTMILWDTSSPNGITTIPLPNDNCNISIVPKSTMFVTFGGSNSMTLMSLLEGSSAPVCVQTLNNHTGTVLSVAFDKTGRLMVSCSFDCTAILWRMLPGHDYFTCVATLVGHSHAVTSAVFHSILPLLATSSMDKNIKVWWLFGEEERTSAIEVATLEGHTHFVNTVDWSPNGESPVSGGADGSVKSW
jgi:WD40 repeat protein